jgi:DNA-directed RNA polymerase specialized sigma subunit
VNRFDAENGTDVLAFAVPTTMGEVADISAFTDGR